MMFVGLVLALLGAELSLRIASDEPFAWRRLNEETPRSGNARQQPRALYHERLGWLPNPARRSMSGVTCTIGENFLRSNGPTEGVELDPTGLILAVGDSFTFGSEVEDAETWPAHLADTEPGLSPHTGGVRR